MKFTGLRVSERINTIEEKVPKSVGILLEAYTVSFVQVVRWVFAGGIAGITVDLLESGGDTYTIGLILLIISFVFALLVLPLRLIMSERVSCPHCEEPFEIRNALDLKKYENHLLDHHRDQLSVPLVE